MFANTSFVTCAMSSEWCYTPSGLERLRLSLLWPFLKCGAAAGTLDSIRCMTIRAREHAHTIPGVTSVFPLAHLAPLFLAAPSPCTVCPLHPTAVDHTHQGQERDQESHHKLLPAQDRRGGGQRRWRRKRRGGRQLHAFQETQGWLVRSWGRTWNAEEPRRIIWLRGILQIQSIKGEFVVPSQGGAGQSGLNFGEYLEACWSLSVWLLLRSLAAASCFGDNGGWDCLDIICGHRQVRGAEEYM